MRDDGVSVFGSARIGEVLISPDDKELLLTAETPEEVCDHVRRATEAQKQLT
ncbi:MAG TPA: hypothetical protein VIS95_06890 [Solirubrobacterales bacterium]